MAQRTRQFSEVRRTDGDDHHAGELVVLTNRSGELNCPLARDFAKYWFADEQPVYARRSRVDLKMLAITQIGYLRWLGEVGKSHFPVTVDDADLKGQARNAVLPALDYLGKRLPVTMPLGAQVEQQFVNALEGGKRIFGEHPCMFLGTDLRLFQQFMLSVSQFVISDTPHCTQERQGQKHTHRAQPAELIPLKQLPREL